MTPELKPLSPNYHTTPTGKRFNSPTDLMCTLPYTARAAIDHDAGPHHDTACRISVLFLDIFWTISSTILAPDQLASTIRWQTEPTRLRIVRMPSPVQSNCDAHDTLANGQYGAVWSMGHTQQVCVRIVLLPSIVWQLFFGRSAFLRQQETDLPPAELWCACSFC
ncbi:hypothetical protein TNCV_1946681 [Trichonephila clavipes]|uniref:Uncharacterized protein n=1 Tax=Trichonephila clavipes TaxID=2585209 RepID=A0A8X6SER9_TRICX|nr:hypothetical protein TNCV_1946681 [Trichonephila clavipes]